jgi:hypothetical protein
MLLPDSNEVEIMPENTVARTFSILQDTDRKMEELMRLTLHRSKSSIIDIAIAKLWEQVVNGNDRIDTLPPSITHPSSNLLSD